MPASKIWHKGKNTLFLKSLEMNEERLRPVVDFCLVKTSVLSFVDTVGWVTDRKGSWPVETYATYCQWFCSGRGQGRKLSSEIHVVNGH